MAREKLKVERRIGSGFVDARSARLWVSYASLGIAAATAVDLRILSIRWVRLFDRLDFRQRVDRVCFFGMERPGGCRGSLFADNALGSSTHNTRGPVVLHLSLCSTKGANPS